MFLVLFLKMKCIKGRHVILLVFCFVFSSHLVQWCYLIEKGRMGSNIEGTEMAILM